MSIKVMNNVWQHSPQKGSKLLLLLALADHCNDDGVCWPSHSHLAEKIRMSSRQTKRLMSQLEEEHEIESKRRFTNGGRQTSNYYLLAEKYVNGVSDKMSPRSDMGDTPGGDIAVSPKPSKEYKRTVKHNSKTKETITR